ncbi:VOC family protein [Streptomyces sp. NPDC048603]|uniref:VOC family protein n=1 Tax=Streptomyces sp. NPDC048603 TaxID=3365577 RepID=UPI00371FD5FF
MLRGVATIGFRAEDLAAATRWYTELLGFPPCSERPGYTEFRIGDHQQELGITDAGFASPREAAPGPGGAVLYWHVDDLEAARRRLLDLGATEYQPVVDRGSGFVTAAVTDPFGNVLGIMTNPHYLDVLGPDLPDEPA